MKKRLGIFGYACAATLASLTLGASADPVKFQDFRWQNRFIVDCDLRDDDADRKPGGGFFGIFAADEDNERRLALLVMSPEDWMILRGQDDERERIRFDQDERARMMSLLNCSDGERVIGLIGLDGGVKRVWRDDIPSVEEIYALIDAMPMRVQEMRRD